MRVADLGRELWGTATDTVGSFLRDDCINMAASLAFFTLFSLAPLVLVLLWVTGLFLSPARIEGELVAQVGAVAGAAGERQIREILGAIDREAEGGAVASVVGIAVTLFAATTVLAQLQSALNRAWGVRRKPGGNLRRFVRKRLVSLGMVVAMAVLLLVSLTVSAGLQAWSRWLVDLVPSRFDALTFELLDIGGSWLVFSLVIGALYKVVPDARIRWRDIAVGAVVTAGLFVVGKELLGVYLGRTAFGSSYGAAGSLAVVLAWVFYSSAILLLGAEFTHVRTLRRGHRVVPQEDAELDDEGHSGAEAPA